MLFFYHSALLSQYDFFICVFKRLFYSLFQVMILFQVLRMLVIPSHGFKFLSWVVKVAVWSSDGLAPERCFRVPLSYAGPAVRVHTRA